jgi:predicted RNA-binding Zn ribbon-like protein
MLNIPMWDWLGEPLPVDVANTIRRHGMIYVELWRTGADVVEWAHRQHGRVPVPSSDEADDRLDELRSVRDDVFALLLATTSGGALPGDVTARVNARARTLVAVHELADAPGRIETSVVDSGSAVDELIALVIAALIDLIGGSAHGDVGFCDAPSCGQFFMRERPNRRWCGAACGSRARVARHADRAAAH